MGLFDKIKGALGGDAKAKVETVKGPTTVLREAGIDPSCVNCRIAADGSLTVTGSVGSGAERDRIIQLLEGIPQVSRVVNEINVVTPEPEAQAGSDPVSGMAEEPAPESEETTPESGGRTYTVKPGDTLWNISKEMYGDGSKYMKIFEANAGLLDDPNKIFPGQELNIPELED